MIKQLLSTLLFTGLICTRSVAQIIETPANTALTITADMTLPSGKALQIDGGAFLKLLPGTTGNVMLGLGSGNSNTVGKFSTYLGHNAGFVATSDSNTFVGYQSGYAVTTGKSNTYFGSGAGRSNATGSRNTYVGRNAGPGITNGDDNVYMGYNTGTNDSGSQNTFLGSGAGVLMGANRPLANATALGAGAQVSASNALILGHNANVGIGTAAPKTKLEVVSETADKSGVRLTNLTATSRPALATDQFLTVNENGDVVKASYRLKVSTVNDWSDKVFERGYPLMPLTGVEQFIRANKHLPGMPSAAVMATDGVDAARLSAKLLEKIEELTLYMIEMKKENQQKNSRIEQLEKQVQALRNK
ncbi:MAG: hypothetical protein H7Z72_04430 [Bacteroidetes bacterium]|nr:hypothetical protein [Fibrella sp.]